MTEKLVIFPLIGSPAIAIVQPRGESTMNKHTFTSTGRLVYCDHEIVAATVTPEEATKLVAYLITAQEERTR